MLITFSVLLWWAPRLRPRQGSPGERGGPEMLGENVCAALRDVYSFGEEASHLLDQSVKVALGDLYRDGGTLKFEGENLEFLGNDLPG